MKKKGYWKWLRQNLVNIFSYENLIIALSLSVAIGLPFGLSLYLIIFHRLLILASVCVVIGIPVGLFFAISWLMYPGNKIIKG